MTTSSSRGPGQVLVRVQVSSVKWLDAGIAHGMLTETAPHKLPIAVGRDFAGIVAAVGEGIRTLAVGDEVFGEVPMGEPVHDGAWAEVIATGEHALTRKPAEVDIVTAGVAALEATTAVMAVDALDLTPGDTVYVLPRGGDVVAVVRAHHRDGVDALLDAVTAYEITSFEDVVRDGGRIASPTDAAGYGPGRTNVTHGPVHRDPRACGTPPRRRHARHPRRADLRSGGRGDGPQGPGRPPHARQDRPARLLKIPFVS